MIDKRELRIGNCLYLKVKNEDFANDYHPMVIRIKDGSHIDLIANHHNQEDFFEPIPLTSSILENCGLEITGNLRAKKWFRLNTTLLIEKKEEGVFYVFYKHKLGVKDIRQIYFLHQFQNLVFDLTNQELENQTLKQKLK